MTRNKTSDELSDLRPEGASPVRPYTRIVGPDGAPALAGLDGAVLPLSEGMPPDWMVEAQAGEDGKPAAVKYLRLRAGQAVKVRFTEYSFKFIKMRLVRHWWHGVSLDCSQLSHPGLVNIFDQRPCPLCGLIGAYDVCFTPVLVEDGDDPWPHGQLLETNRALRHQLKAYFTAHRDLEQAVIVTRGPLGVVLKPGGVSTLTQRQVDAARLSPLPVAHIHQQIKTLTDCVAHNLDNEVDEGRLEALETAMPGALFIPHLLGTKIALQRDWTKFTAGKMREEYHRRLLDQMNIALVCGPHSNNYGTADVDDDEGVERFLAANPWAVGAQFSSSGNRGGNFCFQLKGKYPAKVTKLFYKQRAGSRIVKPYGEFRTGGCTTTLSGFHPIGTKYTIKNLGIIPVITADQLVVPDGVYFKPEIVRVREGVPKGKGLGVNLNAIEGLRRVNDGWIGRCPVCAEQGMDTKCEHLKVFLSGAYWCLNCQKEGSQAIYGLIKRRGLDNERGVNDDVAETPAPDATEEIEDDDEE